MVLRTTGRALKRVVAVLCITCIAYVMYVNYGVLSSHLSRDVQSQFIVEGQRSQFIVKGQSSRGFEATVNDPGHTHYDVANERVPGMDDIDIHGQDRGVIDLDLHGPMGRVPGTEMLSHAPRPLHSIAAQHPKAPKAQPTKAQPTKAQPPGPQATQGQAPKARSAEGTVAQSPTDNHAKPSKLYVVYGCSFPTDNDYTYAFYLPLTALSWEWIGFHSVVVLTGSQSQWNSHPLLGTIVQWLSERQAIVLYLDGPPQSLVMLSQVARLFVTGLRNFSDTDYLVTSDADLWPLNRDYLLLPPGKQVLSTNALCCGEFVHTDGRRYQMIPMGSVGATVATWRHFMSRDGQLPLPSDPEGILAYMEKEFGPVVRHKVDKGENLGWYLDQRTVTVRVTQWADIHGADKVEYGTRSKPDRLDRTDWRTGDLENKRDAHMLERAYESGSWLRLRPLLLYMYGGGSPDYIWCEEYRSAVLQVKGRG